LGGPYPSTKRDKGRRHKLFNEMTACYVLQAQDMDAKKKRVGPIVGEKGRGRRLNRSQRLRNKYQSPPERKEKPYDRGG